MTSEEIKEKLRSEGFKHIYEWRDEAGAEYARHAHKDKVAFYITDGSLTFRLGEKTLELKTSDRFDVPPGQEHTATVGPNGCAYIVGEMIEGDS